MEHKRSSSSFIDHDDSETSSENAPDSPLSGVDSRAAATATATALPNKKSRRGVHKRVVSVPIAEVDGSRSGGNKGDAYPPSDSWAWRKYGQKPIKGSPYPRGYYRCSSSKGCPARKQVERSHANPSMLVITYASDHNHPAPTSKHHNHHNSASTSNPTVAAATSTHAANSSPAPSTPSTNNAAVGEDTNITTTQDNKDLFADPVPDFEMGGDTLLGVGTRSTGDFSWLSDVSFDVPSLVGPRCDDADVAMFPVLREEDESLFADLGELPECSAVFRRGRGMERCKMGPPAPPLCGSTG